MFKNIFIILTLCLMLLVSAIPAFALQDSATSNVNLSLGQFKAKLDSENVPKDKQDLLIAKILKGELIDANNPEVLATVPEDFFKIETGNTEKKYVFADGSYIKFYAIPVTLENRQKLMNVIGSEEKVKSLLDKNSSTVGTMGSGSGSGNINMWIQEDHTMSGGGFDASFYLNPNGYAHFVGAGASNPLTWSFGGTCPKSSYRLSVDPYYETASNTAKARFTYTYIAAGDLGQYNRVVTLELSGQFWWSYIR